MSILKLSLFIAALAVFDSISLVKSSHISEQEAKRAVAPSWQQYLRAPTQRIVHPVAIVANRTTGVIENAESLINPGSGVATFSRNTATDTAPSITLDFGLNVVGFPQISFTGASSNSPGIMVAFSETLEYLTNRSDFTRSDNGDTITDGTDQFAVPTSPVTWTDTYGCLHGTQVCADGLHGFRYMSITLNALESDAPFTSAIGEVNISSVSLNYTAFLGTPNTFTGWFESSDSQLNQFWFDAVYTNDMVIDFFEQNTTDPRNAFSETLNNDQVIFDGAKRDRDPYVGDIAVSGRTLYLSHNLSIAARNILVDLAKHQRDDGWIPPASINDYTLPLFDYPLYWVVSSYDLYLYTNDIDYITTYYPVLVKVLDDYYVGNTDATTGLLTKEEGYGDYAFLPRTGIVTYYNALYVFALQQAAAIANFTGQTDDASRWLLRASTVAEAINANLWDDSVGAYYDFLPATSTTPHAQDGNSLAILSQTANATRASSALTYYGTAAAQVYGHAFYDSDEQGAGFSTRVYAFISSFELRARFLTPGFAISGLTQLRDMYGWMSTHDPFLTFWEGIGAGGMLYEEGFTSAAHGWSTGVVSVLSNYLLGVEPTAPGFSNFTVRPVPGDVTWAMGQVPTPQGPIVVSWAVSATGGFLVNVTAPEGTSGQVSVPVGNGSTILLDQNVVWSAGSSGKDVSNYVSVQVNGGGHTVEVV